MPNPKLPQAFATIKEIINLEIIKFGNFTFCILILKINDFKTNYKK